MKKLLTNKQMESLMPYESHFSTVIKAKYKRVTSSRVNDIVADIYEEATGEIVKRTWSCAKCVYSLFEKCGRLYYMTMEHMKATAEAKEAKKKVGRPKTNKNKAVKTNKDAQSKV